MRTVMSAVVALWLPLTAACAGAADEPAFPFAERFDAGAAGRWHPLSGKWEFGDGFVKQTDADRNCAAAIKIKPEGPYWLAIRFRPESNHTGGGLVFGLPEADKLEGGLVIRCEPEDRIIWGRVGPNGRMRRTNEAIYDDDGDREQELAVAVDPAKGAFNLYHHGERIASNNRVEHATGYVGIVSSGGPHTFLKFEVRPATAQELEGIKEPGPYSQIVDVVAADPYIVALRRGPDLLTIYNDKGEPRGSFKAADLPGLSGADARPVALALAHLGLLTRSESVPPDVLVGVEGGASIYKLKNAAHAVGAGPLYRNEKMQATALAVGHSRIFIADAALPGIRVLDQDGKELTTFGEKGDLAPYDPANPKPGDKFKNPRGIAVAPTGEIVVTDRESFTFVVFKFDPATNQFAYAGSGPWIPNPAQVFFDSRGKMIMGGLFEYYRSYGGVRVMNINGIGEKTWLAHALRDMSDKVRACQGPGGKYYVVDPDKDRFMILPPDFVEPLPEFKYTADGGVQLTMTKVDGTKAVTTSTEKSKDDRIVVRQKEPVCDTWPRLGPDDLTSYALPAPPAKGKVYVIDMPVLVAVFKQADEIWQEKDEKKSKHVEIDTTGVIDRLKRELAVARQFYWHVSHATLNIQFDYMIVDDPDAKVDGGWIQPSPARELVNKARAKQGLPPIDKDYSLIGIHPAGGFDPTYTDDPGIVGGGGLTPYAYSGYALWNNGQSWLFAHEWGHQLDSYFEKSGFPDWWLNHPDGTVHIGRYGEHWDCNAFLCRRADKMNWLRFKFGTIRAVDDADGDGLADDDPTLPLDEKRFGSDSTKIDTDNDGLDDLAETCAGTFTSSDPRNPDTNGNGIPDGKDPYPQFKVRPEIAAAGSGDERLDAKSAPLGAIRSGWADATLRACYSADTVIYSVTFQKPALSVALPMDWNDDGWFVGQDNVYYSVDLEWPKDGPAKVRAANNCEATIATNDGKTVLSCVVKRPPTRAPLKPGSKIGICPRLGNGGGTIAFLLDPWQLLELELK
jgi:hypothetical protein